MHSDEAPMVDTLVSLPSSVPPPLPAPAWGRLPSVLSGGGTYASSSFCCLARRDAAVGV